MHKINVFRHQQSQIYDFNVTKNTVWFKFMKSQYYTKLILLDL